MVLKLLRNHANVPNVDKEGIFSKPIDKERKKEWWEGLRPYERMHVHQTLASVRRYAHFHPFPGLIPKNALDFSLASTYDHAIERFPDHVDTILQPETIGVTTWRRLRNTKDVLPDQDSRIVCMLNEMKHDENILMKSHEDEMHKKLKQKAANIKYFKNHPVLIGGITERKHPSYVKLMNSSHHAPQTNAGYSRQTGDGNIFVY